MTIQTETNQPIEKSETQKAIEAITDARVKEFVKNFTDTVPGATAKKAATSYIYLMAPAMGSETIRISSTPQDGKDTCNKARCAAKRKGIMVEPKGTLIGIIAAMEAAEAKAAKIAEIEAAEAAMAEFIANDIAAMKAAQIAAFEADEDEIFDALETAIWWATQAA